MQRLAPSLNRWPTRISRTRGGLCKTATAWSGRTAWTGRQRRCCTPGCGRAQCSGGPVEVIRPGDVVWFPPGEKHWHGAAPTTTMTHVAIQEQLDGKAVDWLEHVTDEQYQSAGA